MPSKVWGEINYPFQNFNDCTVEAWEWVNNFIPHFIIDVITYPVPQFVFCGENYVLSCYGPLETNYHIYVIANILKASQNNYTVIIVKLNKMQDSSNRVYDSWAVV